MYSSNRSKVDYFLSCTYVSKLVTTVPYGRSGKYLHSCLLVNTCVPVKLWYAIFHWLSFRRMSSYIKYILSHSAHSLNSFPYVTVVRVSEFCNSPSLPPFGGHFVVLSINGVHLSFPAFG